MVDHIVSASGSFDGHIFSEFIWRRLSDAEMGMWTYNGAMQSVTTTDLGTVDFNWAVLGGAHYSSSANGLGGSQMLMDYVPTGTMTLWWLSNNGLLTGINLGQRWSNIGFLATDPYEFGGNSDVNDFLVTNLVDHHLYDWWIGPNNALQGIDLGPYWANVSLIDTAGFTANAFQLLVSNNLDHHLYLWTVGSTLTGIDLGPVWSNVAYVSWFFVSSQNNTGFLVANTVDHHLYDWWIGPNNTLQGIDLGPIWSNVQFVARGRFDNNNLSSTEILVQNTFDHHLYEWWVTAQGQLGGIDLGPYWANVQLIGTAHYNNASPYSELLVRNTVDGHFYEWWIANNQLQGVDLGAVGGMSGTATAAAAGGDTGSVAAAVAAALATSAATNGSGGATSGAAPTSAAEPTKSAGPTTASPAMDASLLSASSGSTSLLAQAMASFGTNEAFANATSALIGAGPVQQAEIATPIDPRSAHAA
jgi:hypothetical protein